MSYPRCESFEDLNDKPQLMTTYAPTPYADFNAGLESAVERVCHAHPEIDWRCKHPWVYGSLGDPNAPVWFIAENPSDRQLRRVRQNDAELQWAASASDRLFREALYRNGFKGGGPMTPGDWRCYITNIAKAPVVVGEWNGRPAPEKDAQVSWWAPVLEFEMLAGAPRLIVTMGGQAAKYFKRFRRDRWIPAEPPSTQVCHYAFRQKTPLRKAEYHRQFEAVRAAAQADS